MLYYILSYCAALCTVALCGKPKAYRHPQSVAGIPILFTDILVCPLFYNNFGASCGLLITVIVHLAGTLQEYRIGKKGCVVN